jgi:hypothetical protein
MVESQPLCVHSLRRSVYVAYVLVLFCWFFVWLQGAGDLRALLFLRGRPATAGTSAVAAKRLRDTSAAVLDVSGDAEEEASNGAVSVGASAGPHWARLPLSPTALTAPAAPAGTMFSDD